MRPSFSIESCEGVDSISTLGTLSPIRVTKIILPFMPRVPAILCSDSGKAPAKSAPRSVSRFRARGIL